MPNDFPPGAEMTSDPRGRRLESWKEIAAYLGREVTTAQRWEKREGLPVRRLPHAKGGSVSAYTSELDVWREARERGLSGHAVLDGPATDVQLRTDPSTTGGPSEGAPAPHTPPRDSLAGEVPGPDPTSSRLEDMAGAPAAGHGTLEARPLIRGPRRLLWLGAAATVAALVTTVWLRHLPAASPLDSLAILPFANTNGNADLDYVGDGLAEALINHFSAIEGLRVVPRTTTFQLRAQGKDADVRDVGRQLRVRAVLTGRVAQHGDTLLVQVDLTDATSNAQIWGAQYHRAMADLLSIQQDIAQAIASEMQLRLRREERARLTRAATEDREAHLLYLKGVHHWYKMTSAGYELALECFTEAVTRDPGFALAHAWLGATHFQRGLFGRPPPRETIPLAVASLERALALDAGLAEAYGVRGMIRLNYDWDVAAAERDIRRALEVNPQFPLAHSALSHWLLSQRRLEEALDAQRQWLELDPLSLMAHTEHGALLAVAGRVPEAFEQLRRTFELGDYQRARFIQHSVLRAAGRFDEAVEAWIDARRMSGDEAGANVLREALATGGYRAAYLAERDRLLERSRTSYVPPMFIAYAAAGGGDVDGALEYLERAYQERTGDLSTIHVNTRVANLHADPRFLDLVRRVGVDPLARH